jgi:hypothetical protein
MISRIIFFFMICISCSCFAQQDTGRYVHKGLLRAQATLSDGAMLKAKRSNIYLHGNLEYYIDDRVSVRGDGYYFITELGDDDIIKMNHASFAGLSYHFKTKNHIDPYLGFQPGLSVSQVIWDTCPEGMLCAIGSTIDKPVASPLISGVAGFNYYSQKLFHFFIEARYQHGKHLSEMGVLPLDELKFSFGLGWNIR